MPALLHTNIRQHAGAATAHVQISFSQLELDLRITDDGGGKSHNSNGSGHGLIGMRERVALYGGTLTSGPRSGGGLRGSGADLRSGSLGMIRVLIADDQALVRGGFRVILGSEIDIDVVGEAADGQQAIDLASRLTRTSC